MYTLYMYTGKCIDVRKHNLIRNLHEKEIENYGELDTHNLEAVQVKRTLVCIFQFLVSMSVLWVEDTPLISHVCFGIEASMHAFMLSTWLSHYPQPILFDYLSLHTNKHILKIHVVFKSTGLTSLTNPIFCFVIQVIVPLIQIWSCVCWSWYEVWKVWNKRVFSVSGIWKRHGGFTIYKNFELKTLQVYFCFEFQAFMHGN